MTNPSKYMYNLYMSEYGDGYYVPQKKFSTKEKAEKYIEEFQKKENYYPAWKIVKELREVIE